MAYIDYDTELWFGKHEGLTAREILDEEPGYIVWLHNNTNHEIEESLLEEADFLAEEDYFDGFSWGEMNGY